MPGISKVIKDFNKKTKDIFDGSDERERPVCGIYAQYFTIHNIIYVSLHGKDRSHHVQRGNKDPQLSDKPSQQQCPRRLPICLTMTKHLKKKKKKKIQIVRIKQCKCLRASYCFIFKQSCK